MLTLFFRPLPTPSGPPSTATTFNHARHQPCCAAGRGPVPGDDTPSMQTPIRSFSYLNVPQPFCRLWPSQQEEEKQPRPRKPRRGSWVTKILRVRSIWEEERRANEKEEEEEEEEREAVNGLLDEGDRCVGCCDGEDDGVCEVADDQGYLPEIDNDVFSKLLRRATLAEAEFYARMSYLGCLAYAIPKIKPSQLLESHGLRFVTSSLEKKSSAPSAESERKPAHKKGVEKAEKAEESNSKTQEGRRDHLSASGVYTVVASAASYVHSQTRSILPFGQGNDDGGDVRARGFGAASLEEASFVVTSESVTAVVAAKEEVKEAVANDLSSSQSSPCEWYICDDEKSGTRFFVIQGSETLASWQANLLFEPVRFEGMDALVHRGIYEAAKGIYQQMLPEVRAHLASRGDSATLRFTGHSLGGSLSLLINLMLLVRGEAPASALLPVITFGAPSIFCGGNALLEKLGLQRNHLQAVTLHRDIVPRAFSCTYPDRVAYILKAVNGNFRNHPCLRRQRLLYSPMGEMLILQPEESFSPNHHLLPSGSGLYFLGRSLDTIDARRLLRMAFSAFLNSPHPLEILSDRSAYGADGTVMRDHDVSSYLGAIRAVIRAERKRWRKGRRDHRLRSLWPSFPGSGLDVSSALKAAQGPIDQFRRLAGSQNIQVLVMLLVPARMLVSEALTASATFL